MPSCVKCGTKQSKLSRENLCKNCNPNNLNRVSMDGGNGMKEYYNSSMLSSNPNNMFNYMPPSMQRFPNMDFGNTLNHSTSLAPHNYNPTNILNNNSSTTQPIPVPGHIDPSKSLASLTVADLTQILQPLHIKIDHINTELVQRMNSPE